MSGTQLYSSLRFCPKCGVERLRRLNDTKYAKDKNNARGPEYACDICGFSFRITKSSLVMMAEEMHAELRRCRTTKFMESEVAPAVVEAFNAMGGELPKWNHQK